MRTTGLTDEMGTDSSLSHHLGWRSLFGERYDAVNAIGDVVASWQAGVSRLLVLCFLAIPACSFIPNRQ
jgi:hypothetical protein